MKNLLILRHGKAEGHNDDGDHERNLTERGLREASAMGEEIAKAGLKIDLVVSSDAARAAQTARLAAENAGYSGPIDTRPEIYEAASETLLAIVQSFDNSADTVLLVGHNPGMSELLADITGKPDQQCELSTAGLAWIELSGKWDDTSKGAGHEIRRWTP